MQGMFGTSLSLPVVELSMRIVAKFRACASLLAQMVAQAMGAVAVVPYVSITLQPGLSLFLSLIHI